MRHSSTKWKTSVPPWRDLSPPKGEFWARSACSQAVMRNRQCTSPERALDSSKNVLAQAKRDLGNSPSRCDRQRGHVAFAQSAFNASIGDLYSKEHLGSNLRLTLAPSCILITCAIFYLLSQRPPHLKPRTIKLYSSCLEKWSFTMSPGRYEQIPFSGGAGKQTDVPEKYAYGSNMSRNFQSDLSLAEFAGAQSF